MKGEWIPHAGFKATGRGKPPKLPRPKGTKVKFQIRVADPIISASKPAVPVEGLIWVHRDSPGDIIAFMEE